MNGKSRPGGFGSLLDKAATLASIGAGVYLLSLQTVAGNSIFESLAHGIGVYFIAKGIFMARSLHLQSEAVDRATRLVEFKALEHERSTRDS